LVLTINGLLGRKDLRGQGRYVAFELLPAGVEDGDALLVNKGFPGFLVVALFKFSFYDVKLPLQ
jgi:hypothetical protein